MGTATRPLLHRLNKRKRLAPKEGVEQRLVAPGRKPLQGIAPFFDFAPSGWPHALQMIGTGPSHVFLYDDSSVHLRSSVRFRPMPRGVNATHTSPKRLVRQVLEHRPSLLRRALYVASKGSVTLSSCRVRNSHIKRQDLSRSLVPSTRSLGTALAVSLRSYA